ncbi:hypothetical protein [Deinococcus altitudinis]|uniref:hypothetical protein n=1 Tax=Deinococcus altitudinis TaxID=468914 RepID=UPI003891B575
MNDWKEGLSAEIRDRVQRVEAGGGVFRWYDEQQAGQTSHFLHGVLYGIPMVGAGPLESPLSQADRDRAVAEVSERLATVLGVLEAPGVPE